MFDMNTIASRLKFLRERKDWTQTQLAVAADVSQGTVGNIESGARAGKGSLIKLAKALDASLDWLIDGVGSPVQETIREPSSMLSAVTAIPLLNKDTAGMFQDYLNGKIQAENVHNYHDSKTDGLFAFAVEDDLMEPNIPKGCQAIINTKLRPKHGASVLIHDGKTSFIRRLVIDGSNTLMQSAYSSQPLQGSIIGVVQQITIWFHDLGEDE